MQLQVVLLPSQWEQPIILVSSFLCDNISFFVPKGCSNLSTKGNVARFSEGCASLAVAAPGTNMATAGPLSSSKEVCSYDLEGTDLAASVISGMAASLLQVGFFLIHSCRMVNFEISFHRLFPILLGTMFCLFSLRFHPFLSFILFSFEKR